MSEPRITIRFDGNGRVYLPGESLSGEYWLEGVGRSEVRVIEVAILWATEGKGDEDLSVHDFRRLAVEEGDEIDPRWPGRFRTVLPNSPLTYEGVIVKLRWFVRVRAFLTEGRELIGQQRFRLGNIPPAKAVKL